MTPDLLATGSAELYKGVIHLLIFALACVCLAYNGGTVAIRFEWRLVANVVIYLLLAVFEARQVLLHWRNT